MLPTLYPDTTECSRNAPVGVNTSDQDNLLLCSLDVNGKHIFSDIFHSMSENGFCKKSTGLVVFPTTL